MVSHRTSLVKTLIWGGVAAAIFGFLFYYADEFVRLAQTTQDSCAVQEGAKTVYYRNPTPELCAARGGTFTEGSWWFVLAPIAMAFALSYTHGIFTGLFWDIVGMKPRK